MTDDSPKFERDRIADKAIKEEAARAEYYASF